jgi:hypothetical protein
MKICNDEGVLSNVVDYANVNQTHPHQDEREIMFLWESWLK